MSSRLSSEDTNMSKWLHGESMNTQVLIKLKYEDKQAKFANYKCKDKHRSGLNFQDVLIFYLHSRVTVI